MKKGKVGHIFAFFALAILISSPFVFAGIGDWWSRMTGRATTDTATLSVSITNNPPTVYWVNSSFTFDPAEGANNTVTIRFNASDADGSGNLDDSKAHLRATNGGVTISNTSCVDILDFSSNNVQYECKLQFRYYYQDGTWNLNASVEDTSGQRDDNTTSTMTYNVLHAWAEASGSTSALTWAAFNANDQDQSSNNDPFILNNTGNDEDLEIWMNGTNLVGGTTPSEWINTTSFEIDDSTTGCNGKPLDGNITDTNLSVGTNMRLDSARDTQTTSLYFCIANVSGWLSQQSYTSAYGAWNIHTEQP